MEMPGVQLRVARLGRQQQRRGPVACGAVGARPCIQEREHRVRVAQMSRDVKWRRPLVRHPMELGSRLDECLCCFSVPSLRRSIQGCDAVFLRSKIHIRSCAYQRCHDVCVALLCCKQQ
jgi:hypothetical protein